jgi:hypothetical protein
MRTLSLVHVDVILGPSLQRSSVRGSVGEAEKKLPLNVAISRRAPYQGKQGRCISIPSAPLGMAMKASINAPVAQLDRVLASEARGHRFESCRARHYRSSIGKISVHTQALATSSMTCRLPGHRFTGSIS